MYILGTELDYVHEVFGSQFQINNPNAKSACGCGESISFEKETA
jgi:iron-sulfur cluster assembly protein